MGTLFRQMKSERSWKVVLAGDENVGKTSLFCAFQKMEWQDDRPQTVGGSVARVNVANDLGHETNLVVWDTAGQEKFRGTVPMYFSRSAAVLLVFDLTNRGTFESMRYWMDLAKQRGPEKMKIVMIGSKSDLREEREVSVQEAENARLAADAAAYIETSALQGNGIQEVLRFLANCVEEVESYEQQDKIISGKSGKKSGCC
jgi:small GTP-binding protein